MKTITLITFLTLGGGAIGFAHLSYTGRDFGTLDPGNQTTSSTKSGNISSTFGWAYSTDFDLGDSHRNRAFRFTLATAGQVTLSAQASGIGNPLLPALSVYSGLAHLAPDALDHDGSAISTAYLTGLFGAPDIAQGTFNALGDWRIGNDAVAPAISSLSDFTYMGNMADGTSTNYGSASGINGDGTADGYVTGSFNLPAGTYTIMVGGAEYLTNPPVLPVGGAYPTYATNVTVSVVPEVSSSLLVGFSCLGFALRRPR